MLVDISVIIPCFGHGIELGGCLRALEAQQTKVKFEIIVVDSSSESQLEGLRRQFPRAQLIRSPSRLFPGAARNLGVRHAAGAHLAFLDADCVPSERWIEHAFLSLSMGHALIGGPILDVRSMGPIAWVDNHMQFADFQSGRPAGPGDHFPSCNLVVRRDVFAALGGYEEDTLTGEDAVFSKRAAQLFPQGMWFQPQLVVRHHGRRTLQGMLEHQQLLGRYRGRLGLAMTPAWNRLAGSPWFAGLALLRRLGYISLRTWQYDRRGLFRLVFFLPLLLSGLVAWTRGFYQGVHLREMEHKG